MVYSLFLTSKTTHSCLPVQPVKVLPEFSRMEGKQHETAAVFQKWIFGIQSVHVRCSEGVAWGFPGGCLGVPRDPSLETPRQPPANPLGNLFNQRMSGVEIPERLPGDELEKTKQNWQ